ncbi:hypothetical protein AALO_G00108440 [Alosa alosa]|uniref:Uncharacterized protein n=1 Tax=Alosa alosa TaxID=278164 RepID=A0AAV6GS33_9TELE|nr:hypothetical protein AALO_G00108440 [Alosa alosa]
MEFFKRPLSSVQATASPSELTDGVVSGLIDLSSCKSERGRFYWRRKGSSGGWHRSKEGESGCVCVCFNVHKHTYSPSDQ